MIEMRHLKNVVIFTQTILSFVLSAKVALYFLDMGDGVALYFLDMVLHMDAVMTGGNQRRLL